MMNNNGCMCKEYTTEGNVEEKELSNIMEMLGMSPNKETLPRQEPLMLTQTCYKVSDRSPIPLLDTRII